MKLHNFLRFETVIYPLWRRRVPAAIKPLTDALFDRVFPAYIDRHPPEQPAEVARYLVDWQIVPDLDAAEVLRLLEVAPEPTPHRTDAAPALYQGGGLRVPAQWEPTERVLLSWGVVYPTLWPMHAAMAEAISAVADVEILVPSPLWGRGVWAYLQHRGRADLSRVKMLALPTNDIWIRDYGPIMALSPDGQRVAINAIYDVLPQYPQQLDNSMTERWAAHHGIAVRPLDLYTEGGNLWSDGIGTLLMSSQIFYSNRYHDRESLLEELHSVFDFSKLIITPRLTLEETGHVDLLVKLASADTVLVSASTSASTYQVMNKAKRQFERETNAAGQPYQVIELPTPGLYLNWITYTIRRGYTNALTVNGRVLVPTFGLPEDDVALRTYEQAMPDHEIIPIDSRVGINGGGAVHCMTKEVPLA